jgi:hypothetical protein
MKFWKINFIIDTGYEWLKRECVIIADDRERALKKFDEWILPKLHGERFVEDSQTQIKEISTNDYGIIYQNCFDE